MAHLNRIVTAVPPHDVHETFLAFAAQRLIGTREGPVFKRMADRARIAHRWSTLPPPRDGDETALDGLGLYRIGHFPGTAERMIRFEAEAPPLAARAVADLVPASERDQISHVLVTTCTGLSAPGIDLELIGRCGLRPDVERTVIGFMGCFAAITALRQARHIVRSDPSARVLIVSVELCTLHLQDLSDLERLLAFLVFGDGCAAALVSAEPTGFALERFHTVLEPAAGDAITWTVRDQGFDMFLSGKVPAAVGAALTAQSDKVLDGARVEDFDLWAVHPGGRSVLDAVESGLGLGPDDLAASRSVLRDYGNMSSATILFVLEALLRDAKPGARGCGMSFGPGLSAETMLFRAAGKP